MTRSLLTTKNKNIIEGFTPFFNKLTLYKEIMGVQVYSSETIEKEVMGLIKKELPEISSFCGTLIKNKKLLVGYSDPGKLNFIRNKIRKLTGSLTTGELGFFSPTDDTVVILLDHNAKFFGGTFYKIPQLILHELIHKCFYKNNISNILKYNYEYWMGPFYQNIITNLFVMNNIPANMSIDSLYAPIKKLVMVNEQRDDLNTSTSFFNAMTTWKTFFSGYKFKPELERLLTESMVVLYRNDFLGGSSMLIDDDKTIQKLRDIFEQSYKKINMEKSNTIYGQESIFPSEIIAICSKTRPIPGSIINAIKRLKG